MAKLRPMPHPSVPLVDAEGRMTDAWYLYFRSREKIGLNNLSDVSTDVPVNGSVLSFNATTGGWEPQ